MIKDKLPKNKLHSLLCPGIHGERCTCGASAWNQCLQEAIKAIEEYGDTIGEGI